MKESTSTEIRARVEALSLGGDRKRVSIEGFHTASVLVPIVIGGTTPELLFTKRTELVETHKGQVSFPGGMMDSNDKDVVNTALREAWEEIGLPGTAIRVVGLLDDLATPTGFVITPVVAVLEVLPALTPNRDEVAEVFQVPLSFFLDPANAKAELREFRGQKHEVWYYATDSHTIWGATALIVRSLLAKLHLI